MNGSAAHCHGRDSCGFVDGKEGREGLRVSLWHLVRRWFFATVVESARECSAVIFESVAWKGKSE